MYTYIHGHVLACESGYVYYAYEKVRKKERAQKSMRESEKEREKRKKGARVRKIQYARTCVFVTCVCAWHVIE